ncbi:max dimerization protein 3-like [Actinia tenebrosa]|uniref:Max dimerization protein 3-like n=1 Tax=Actinia tenebrosa TaxID=6105 RepID=A0A6P8HP82_ACTTE|nr:max dimerization protein 3-like [Actinia tenebrosa]
MSLDTLLKAAEFVELSSGPKKKENLSNARGNHPNNVYADRRRVVSESEAAERRRRPGGAGTRETHNKLEKNRRAHLKECFDILKKQVPSLEEKKTSNLNILRGALKYIQNMKKQEQEYATECDALKMNQKSLEERLNALKSNTKIKTEQKSSSSETIDSEVSQASSSSVQTLSATTAAAKTTGESRTLPISVATQTPSSSQLGTSVNEEDDEVSTTRISTSSTDTGGEGDESEHKLSTFDDNEDEKTDTDEGLSIDEEDIDQDIEIDVVGGQDDCPSTENLHSAVKEKSAHSNKMNGEVEEGSKRKVEEIPKGRYHNIKSRKRSKSEAAVKNEEDSDYDENTKEEPKAKIQACARKFRSSTI